MMNKKIMKSSNYWGWTRGLGGTIVVKDEQKDQEEQQ
jgi:hypothetical protein